ncbi:MAG: alpha-amylase family glycosyl hydrolase [Flavobacteriales bacterium]
MKRIYEISIPHFTTEGTFDAAIRQLSALDSLEIDALYLLPINPTDIAHSKSPYCITDNFQVRKELGGLEGLKLFTGAIHMKGMKVVLDVVLNHASINHKCAQDKDFFSLDGNESPFHPIGTNWNDVFQINHFNEYNSGNLLNSLFSFLALGIDGFRFDATSFLPNKNIEHWLSELTRKKSDVILWSDSSLLEKDALPFTHVSAPLGKSKFEEPRKAIQIASLGSHDLLRNQGSLLEVYGENVSAIQKELIQQSEAFLFPMGSEKGFDFKYDFFL